MPLIQQVSVITIVLAFLSALCVSVNDMKQDIKTCTNVTWRWKNFSVTFNESSVLKKGDGGKQNVQTEVIKEGVVKDTISIIVCCPAYSVGYHVNRKGQCKKCKRGMFGENCLEKCKCDKKRNCDHVTGACNKPTNETECKRGWFGDNCLEKCKCDKKRKCDRGTGACKKCRKPPCDDEPTNEIDATPPITTVSTTPVQVPTQGPTTDKSSDPTTGIINKTESTPSLNSCVICVAANNCTEEQNCNGLTAGRADTPANNEDKESTILIAVILSLGTCTILLLVGIVFRERCHKSRKRRQRDIVKFSDDTEYVDPEPIYFEIKDDDVICNGHACQNESNSDTPKASNDYQTCDNINRSDSSEPAKDNIEDKCGYLNPYTPLRFARSETNLYRDKNIRKQGEYDVIYSIAKSIPQENNAKDEENSDRLGEDNDKLESSSQKEKLLTDGPVYFVLEKVQKEADSHDIEREKLLSRSLRTRGDFKMKMNKRRIEKSMHDQECLESMWIG